MALAGALLLAGALVGGNAQVVLVLLAVVIDPIGAFVGGGRGWFLSVGHFVERHGLIVIIIAIGESLIALGLAASAKVPTAGVMALVVMGALLASLVYLLYFRRVAPALEAALGRDTGLSQVRMARDVYSYGHLLVIGGIVAMALWLKKSAAAIAEDGLDAHLHGLAAPSLAVAGVLLVGGLGLLLVRAGCGSRCACGWGQRWWSRRRPRAVAAGLGARGDRRGRADAGGVSPAWR